MDELEEFVQRVGEYQRYRQYCPEEGTEIYLWYSLEAAEEYLADKSWGNEWKPVCCDACQGYHITEKEDVADIRGMYYKTGNLDFLPDGGMWEFDSDFEYGT